jgi:hypothetical protein
MHTKPGDTWQEHALTLGRRLKAHQYTINVTVTAFETNRQTRLAIRGGRQHTLGTTSYKLDIKEVTHPQNYHLSPQTCWYHNSTGPPPVGPWESRRPPDGLPRNLALPPIIRTTVPPTIRTND